MSTLTLSPRRLAEPASLFDGRATVADGRVTVADGRATVADGRVTVADGRATVADGPTLDDVIVAGWEQIATGATAPCPVCHGELRPVWAAGSRPVSARCQDCGSSLS